VTSETESQVPIDPSAATEKQANLTTSVGETLTRESHDAEVSFWRRLLKLRTFMPLDDPLR